MNILKDSVDNTDYKNDVNDVNDSNYKNDINDAINEFWDKLSFNWNYLYKLLLLGNHKGVKILNSYLPNILSEKLELEYSFNEINRLGLESYKGHIEIYISPKLNRNNIEVMNKLYNARKNISNLSFAKYKAYNNSLIKEIGCIEYKDEHHPEYFNVNIKDFLFDSTYGFDENKKTVMNLIIVVKQPIANKILKQDKIIFKHADGHTSSRMIWRTNHHNTLFLFLVNLIGEYNLLHHIGYMEILPSDDPLIQNSEFMPLIEIKNAIEFIIKQYNYNYCIYCNHIELQVDLYNCTKCKIGIYCSRKCQKANWLIHKKICNK